MGWLGRAALLVAACAAFGSLAASASATPTHEPEAFSPIDGSGSGVPIFEPSGIAVAEPSGNAFLTDGKHGEGEENNAVLILGGEGGAPAGLLAPFKIAGFNFGTNSSAGVAYDNSAASPAKGTLYVYDKVTQSIKRYTRDGPTEQYKEELPAIAATGAGGEAGLGLDAAGNVYLGSNNAKSVYKFSPAGTLLHKWTSPAELPLQRPGQVAVDAAGDLFIQRQGQNVDEGGAWKCPVGAGEAITPASCIHFQTENATGVAYDPANNHVFVALGARIAEYDATSLALVSEFGEKGVNGEEGILEETARIAVNAEEERIYVVDKGKGDVAVFGPLVTVPTTKATAATEVTGTKATLNGSVNPEGIAVSECLFEYGETTAYGKTAPCEALPPVDSEFHPVSAKVSGLLSNGHVYHFRLRTKNANGTEKSNDKTLTTADTVTTEAASAIAPTTATLNGTVRPEGVPYTACVFEWGPTTTAGFAHTNPCNPAAGEIEADFAAHPVSLALSGLEPNATYKFRVSATNETEGTLPGATLTFTTTGPPQISEVRASGATHRSVTLEAKINPRGFSTSYRFEWGPTAAYGHRVPADFDPPLEAAEDPIAVNGFLSGLATGATYHYRVVATSPAGVTTSPDQTLETLNACNLPEARCLEMVSPREPGPAAQVGRYLGGIEMKYQASEEPGSLVYVVEAGLPDATRGTELLYQGARTATGWSSQQLSPPIAARDEQSGIISSPSQFYGFSRDLRCGAFGSLQPVAGDPPGASQILEAGGGNLYRRNADGSSTLITAQPPELLGAAAQNLSGEFELTGMSSDCSKIVFATKHHYPGAGGVGTERLYEWEAGSGISNVGQVPKEGGGEEAVEAVGGSPLAGGNGNRLNAVSEDGSRVFFSAKRLAGAVSGEVGKTGVFAREGGTHTIDVSTTETSTPDENAEYQGATPNGRRVYFTANAGLTAASSPEGRDLYEYDFEAPEGERLTDLSATSEEGGARVGGSPLGALVGFANDGSRVYFIARGQLDPGRGPTLAENEADGTYSLYERSAAGTRFVGTVDEAIRVTVGRQAELASRVSADGRYLLFESSAKVTGYDSGGVQEAYLYDAQAGPGEEATTCLSCRQDGKAPVDEGSSSLLALPTKANPLYQPQSLAIRGGEPVVFFRSKDALAPGGTEGIWNLYEWSHNQVFHVATEDAAHASPSTEGLVIFAGASAEGEDLYFFDGAPLNWEDPEGRPAAWDARIGGGFPEPPPPPPGCEAASEGSCQGPAAQAPSAPSAGSARFSGPGNVKPKKQSSNHHHKKKKKKKAKSKKHNRGKARNERAGK